MPKPSELAAQSPATVASLRSVLGVGALEAVVESAAGPTYASIALGEAATTTGQSFAVDNGDGTVSIYLRTGGGSTLQRTMATTAALAGNAGAQMVGHLGPASGEYPMTAAEIFDSRISVLRFIPPGERAGIRNYSSTYDCTAGIQAAVNYSIYLGGRHRVHIPSGKYTTTGPIHLGYGDSYTSVYLEGDGSNYRGESPFCGTTIAATHSDAPALIVQGGRRTTVKSLSLVGANASHIGGLGLGFSPSVRDVDVDAWIGGSLHANANSRYAPYAGIAIDPYSGPRPGTSYPDVAYPAVVGGGSVPQYGKNYTDGANFEDMYVGGFVVGCAIQPCDADGNGDHIAFRSIRFEHCAYGISVGNSQGRATNIENCQFFGIHTCFTNIKHGKLRGKFGGTVSGCSFNGVIRLIDIDTGYNGPFFMQACYGEIIWQIGNAGSIASSNAAVVLSSCEFGFDNEAFGGGASLRGIPGYTFYGANNCLVIDSGKYVCKSVMNIRSQLEVRGAPYIVISDFDLAASFGDDKIAFAGATMGVIGDHIVAPRIKRHALLEYGTTAHSEVNAQVVGAQFPANLASRTRPLPATTTTIGTSQPHFIYGFPWALMATYWDKSALTIDATDPQAVTIDLSLLEEWQKTFGVSKGDHIKDAATGTILRIASIASSIATCTALNNWYTEAGVKKWQFGVFSPTGTFYHQVNRMFAVRYPMFGDITEGSAVITNVARADGYLPPGQIDVGDYIMVSEHAYRPFVVGTKIGSINTGARTITMSGAAQHTQTRVPLCVWVRAEL